MKSVSLAVILLFGVTMFDANPAVSGSGEPASQMLKKKKLGAGDGAPASQNWSNGSAKGGAATTVTEIVTDGGASPFLLPDGAVSMQAVADRYAGIVASGGWPKVPSGKLTKGATGKATAALNRRLWVEGYLRQEATEGQFAEVYTTATEDAVRRFQRNHGLAVTGSVDGPTLSQLNVPAERRLATIRANVPRVAEYSRDLGSRYVVVNIPAMQIETVNDGRVYSRHNAVVGRPSRPTPVVITPLVTIRFNPYWNAPASIVEKDIVPRMISGGASKIMNDMNMKIFDGVGGPEINPNSVNWRRAVVDNYHFRQEPGGSNAMKTAKIEFDSPFGIYLHDTPEPELLSTRQRFYSSGCIRVDKVAIFINWILQGQDGIDSSRIAELAETKERLDTKIVNPPQIRVAYLTAWPARDGVAAFRDDVYELDGSGFVLGQPLPVGESIGGKRYVLKPIPRSQEAVDEAEAFGFGSLFGRSRNPDKQDGFTRISSSGDADDSLISTRSKAKDKAKLKTAKKTALATAVGPRNPDKQEVVSNWSSTKAAPAKKKLAKKPDDRKMKSLAAKKADAKSKTAKAEKTKSKKVLKKDEQEVAAKKPDATAKKKVASATRKPVAEQCKAGADGKLPSGCKPPAKKQAPKVEEQASAVN